MANKISSPATAIDPSNLLVSEFDGEGIVTGIGTDK
jgi:hypothetical protein